MTLWGRPSVNKLGWASLAATLLVAGCATNAEERTDNLGSAGHIHNLATNGSEIWAGTHAGLYQWEESSSSWLRLGPSFDVMGLAHHDQMFWASGHPGSELDSPDPIGLIRSGDHASTWQSHALTGEVDFHLLDVSGTSMVGVAANYGVMLRSVDSGSNWESFDVPALTDFALNPQNPQQLLIATGEGLLLSDDLGENFTELDVPEGITTVEWADTSVVIGSASGLFSSKSPTGPFVALDHTFSDIRAIAASGDVIAVLDAGEVIFSVDRGGSFTRD